MDLVLMLHNLLRWAILVFGAWAVINAISGLSGKREFSPADKRSALLFMVFFDLQLLLGFILFFVNGWSKNFSAGMGNVMKDGLLRFFTVEHTLMMFVAWILVHIGYSSVKKAAPQAKHKKMLVFFGLALLLILVSIPWPFREQVARPLFRGL